MSQGLQEFFLAFASYGTREAVSEIDGAKFIKLFKDAGMLKSGLTSTDIDLIFSKVKVKGQRKIGFPQFKDALAMVAEKKKMSVDELTAKLVEAGGPKTNATKADFVKFHDDKSTYTGVYKNGGPTNVDGTGGLNEICNRKGANVRGVTDGYRCAH